SDGRDALVKALVRVPSLVMTELRLPLIDGLTLCSILRTDRVTERVPILIVTSDTRPSAAAEARRLGVDAMLVKPTPACAVLLEMQRLLARSTELGNRSATARATAVAQLQKAADPFGERRAKRVTLPHAHDRALTSTPPMPPPELVCPGCDRFLTYTYSQVGGVSARYAEQWDYYTCGSACGTFQYRQRTRTLRRLS